MGLALSEKETCGCQEPAEAVPSPTTSDEWTKVTCGILADMLRQNIPGHMQPGLWGPSERLARGCEVNEKEKGKVMRPEVQSDAKGWRHDRMAFDLLRARIPGTKRRMARVSRLAQWTLAKAASLSKTMDTDGSTTPVAIMASPLKAPLGMKRAKDGHPIKECSGAEHQWRMAM